GRPLGDCRRPFGAGLPHGRRPTTPGAAVSADEPTIRAVFFAALEKAPPAERSAYLDGACAKDADLRREVEVLLRAHDRPDPLLDQPAAQGLAAEGGADLGLLEPSAKPGSPGRPGPYRGAEGRG